MPAQVNQPKWMRFANGKPNERTEEHVLDLTHNAQEVRDYVMKKATSCRERNPKKDSEAMAKFRVEKQMLLIRKRTENHFFLMYSSDFVPTSEVVK